MMMIQKSEDKFDGATTIKRVRFWKREKKLN